MKRRLLPLLLTVVLVVAAMVPVFALTAAADEITKYTFSDYTAGTQYAENEEHKLDDTVTVVTYDCHFTAQLRIYSSSTNNGYAIIQSTNPITKIAVNAGNKADTLLIYGSNDDGATWTEVGSITTTSTSYKDYSATFDSAAYKWLKLDVKGSNQIRIASMTLTTKEPENPSCAHKYSDWDVISPATCTENGQRQKTCSLCQDVVKEDIPATGHSYGDDNICDNDNCGYERPAGFVLVTDAGGLKVGDQIIIVATEYNFALGTTQNGNNRSQAAITKDGDVVSIDDNVQIITLEAGTVDGTFAFYVEGEKTGYLYAASSSSNYLRTQEDNDANGIWAITITDEGVATIKAQGTNSKNWLRYNQTSSLFACYGSGQQDIAIYKMPAAACQHDWADANCDTPMTCKICGATEGEALGHDWVNADCDTPKTCERCEATEGEALGHNFVNGKCSVCSAQPKFDAVSMLVSNDLALNYLVKVPTDFTGKLTVKFTVGGVDGKVIWGELQNELNNGRYVFSLYGIAPQDIAKNIKAELFVDGVKLEGADKDYSVLQYITNIKDKYKDDKKLVALLDSVLVYGQVAKDYIGADGDAIADAGLVNEALNAATKPNADFNLDANRPVGEKRPEGEKPYANYFTGASVRFDYVNKLCLKIYAEADEFTVYVDGEAVEAMHVSGNNYVVYVDVMIKDFDRLYKLEIKVDGVATHTMSYSVNNYLVAMWDDADLKNLAKATYLLGVAADEYAGAAVEDQLN